MFGFLPTQVEPSSFLWLIAEVIVLWMVIQWLMFKILGVSVGIIDPLRLRIRSLRFRDILTIRFIYYSIWNHGIVVHGLKLGLPHKDKVKSSVKTTEKSPKNYFSVPRWGQWLLIRILNLFRQYNFVLEKSEVFGVKVDVLTAKLVGKGTHMKVTIYMKDMVFGDLVSCSGFILEFTGKINFQRPALPLEDIAVDLKSRGVSVSLTKLLDRFEERQGAKNAESEPRDHNAPEELRRLTAEESINYFKSCLVKASNFMAMIDKVYLSLDTIHINDIALSRQSELREAVRSMSFEVSASSITFAISRLKIGSPGFKLLFSSDDSPLNVKSTASSITLSVIEDHEDEESGPQSFQFCEIPSVAIYGDTNLLSLSSLEETEGKAINTVLKLVGHISSPVVDFEILQYSALKGFRDNIKVFTTMFADQDASETIRCECEQVLQRKQSVAMYFQHILPLVESKITVEDPMILVSDGCELLVQRCSILSIQTKSDKYTLGGGAKSKEVFYKLKNSVELMDYAFTYHNKERSYEHRILTVDNISILSMTQITPKLLASCNAGVDTCSLDLSELSTLMAINKIWRKANSKILLVEEEYFGDLYERFSDFLSCTMQKSCAAGALNEGAVNSCTKELLFKALPSFFDGLRASIRDLSVTVGARSVFMTKDLFTNLEPQSPEDLVDGELRKINQRIGKIGISLSGGPEASAASAEESSSSDGSTLVGPTKVFSYDELGLDDSSSNFSNVKDCVWSFRCVFQDMITTLYSEKRTKRQTLSPKTVCKMPELELGIYPTASLGEKDEVNDGKVMISLNSRSCEMMLSLMTVFLAISAVHTFKQTFSRDVNQHSRESKAKFHLSPQNKKSKANSVVNRLMKREVLKLVQFDMKVGFLGMVMILPNGVKTRLETFQTALEWTDMNSFSLEGHFLRFCVESPQVTNFWVRMATVVNFKIEGNVDDITEQIQNPPKSPSNQSLTLSNETWNFYIPHAFEMCQIFDNISTTVKSIKQMIYSLKTANNKCVTFPHVSKAIALPVIKLESKRWIFSVEDDAFESELGMIFQVGLEEQRSRIEKYSLFEKAVAKEMASKQNGVKRYGSTLVDPDRNNMATNSRYSRCISRQNSEPNLSRKQSEPMQEQKARWEDFRKYCEISEQRADEYLVLQKQISLSWIRRIKAFKQKMKIDFCKNFEFLWGKVDPACFPPNVNKQIVAFVASPPLMNLIIERINLTISQPSFGIEGIPNFVHDVGKGVPKATEYSILFPMHLDAQFGEIRSHLRDYPLPFFYIPDFTDSQLAAESTAPIRIHGDIILSEDMIRSDKELRTLFVPLVPSATLENDDKFYALLVPRTLTPIKTYTNLNLELNSQETTLVAWNSSYTPAIQQAMQCFDNFSKPPIDPSPKLGFWDKIREIFHARLSLKWCNGGQLNVSLKGGKSPYMIGGEAAGFVVGLKGDVAVGCNITNDSHKFVSLTSNEVFFSIPNFLSKPLITWSRSSKNFYFFPSHENTNLQKYAFYYNLIDLPVGGYSEQDMSVMRDAFFEKTAIKLTGGITLNVGITFERLRDNQNSRTLTSSPHWDARLCNPVFVENLAAHDSFKGFRSDFIHLSFTLLSSNEKAYNALQLTPGAFKTFFSWWKSFSGNLPVRRGPLFGMDSVSPKFGVHLYTISYHADVSPLFISHMHRVFDPDEDLRGKQSLSSKHVGLKAKTEHFVMDLHQRREVMHEHKPELNTTKKTSKLGFSEGDVSTFEIDVRTVQTEFKESVYGDDCTRSIFEIFDGDMTWFDITDYKEVLYGGFDNHIPQVHIDPLVYSPKFVYRKQASYGDKYQVDFETCEKIEPFRNSDYHDCSLHKSVRSPIYLIEDRMKSLEERRAQVVQQLKDINGDATTSYQSSLHLKKSKIEEAISQVSKLLNDFSALEERGGEQEDEETPAVAACDPHDYAEFEWLTKKSFSDSFEHRFFIFSMLLKWNETVRDAVYSYVHLLDLNRELAYITNHKAIRKLNDMINEDANEESRKPDQACEPDNSHSDRKPDKKPIRSLDASEDIFSIFEDGLRGLDADIDHVTHDNHVVQFIAPQMQLTTSKKAEACTMITAPSVKLKTIAFDTNTTGNEYDSDIFLNRYSIALLKANVFVFHKDNFENYHDVFFDSEGHDELSKKSWQPWLGVELCFDSSALATNALIKDLSAIFRFDKVFSFAGLSGTKDCSLENKIICQLPRTIISSNSRQYLALYDIIAHLLVYVEPKSAHLRKEVEKLACPCELF